MSRTTFSITFYCRASKVNKQGQAPLEMCINVNQERLFINLPVKFSPVEFNRKKRPKCIEDIVSQYRLLVNTTLSELMMSGIPITATSIREHIKSGNTKIVYVSDLIDEYLKTTKKKVGVSLTEDGYNKYVLVADFLNEEIGGKHLATLTIGDMNAIYDTLKGKYLTATSGGKMAKVKSIFQYAFDNGYIKTNICSQIKISKGKPNVKYLSMSDMDNIKKLNLDDMERLDKVRDLMLFQASTGLSYADLVAFDMTKIEYINNVPTYSECRQKTKIEFTCVILGTGMDVLNKYNGQLPLISNQKYNAYLKEIQRLAGVQTTITTHLLRKTYAHNLLNSGARIEVVSKCLGHSNTLITQRVYAKTMTSTIAKEIGQLITDGAIS